jgi:hypothetical protein
MCAEASSLHKVFFFMNRKTRTRFLFTLPFSALECSLCANICFFNQSLWRATLLRDIVFERSWGRKQELETFSIAFLSPFTRATTISHTQTVSVSLSFYHHIKQSGALTITQALRALFTYYSSWKHLRTRREPF